MIGQFNPVIVTATVAAVAVSPINTRPANAAAEVSNDVEWLIAQD
jgi:hypothetical protein